MTTLGAAEGPTVTWRKYRDGPRARGARGGSGGARGSAGSARLGVDGRSRSGRGSCPRAATPARARGAREGAVLGPEGGKYQKRAHEGVEKAARGVASAPPRGASRPARDRSERVRARVTPSTRDLHRADAAGRPRTDGAETGESGSRARPSPSSKKCTIWHKKANPPAERDAPLGGAEAKPRAGRADRRGGRESEGGHRLESRRVSYGRALARTRCDPKPLTRLSSQNNGALNDSAGRSARSR